MINFKMKAQKCDLVKFIENNAYFVFVRKFADSAKLGMMN